MAGLYINLEKKLSFDHSSNVFQFFFFALRIFAFGGNVLCHLIINTSQAEEYISFS